MYWGPTCDPAQITYHDRLLVGVDFSLDDPGRYMPLQDLGLTTIGQQQCFQVTWGNTSVQSVRSNMCMKT